MQSGIRRLGWHMASAIVLLLPQTVSSKVSSADATGFTIESTASVPVSPHEAYAAFVDVARWWDPVHTWSGNAANLSIDARAGGCFCETLPDGGSVQHMQVVYAAPGEQLRLVGGLGPLQEQSVAGSMTWTFAPAEGGCTIGLTYRVAGRIEGEGGAESWAAPVDFVLGSQLERLSKLLSGH